MTPADVVIRRAEASDAADLTRFRGAMFAELARMLLERLLDDLREAGVGYCALSASEAGAGLYESFGFKLAAEEYRLLLTE